MDINYKYWCSSEKKWVYYWSSLPPQYCINDSSHTISDVSIYRQLEPSGREVMINEQRLHNKGYDFFAESVSLDVVGNVVTEKTVSFPMDVHLYGISAYPWSTEHEVDKIDLVVNSQFTGGILTAAASNTAVISVSETVLKYVEKPGWYVITLVDGVTEEEVGRVINIDSEISCITVENTVINSFPIGTLVKVDYYVMKDYEIFTSSIGVDIGLSKIGGTMIPANTNILVRYHNSNIATAKQFIAKLEYTW